MAQVKKNSKQTVINLAKENNLQRPEDKNSLKKFNTFNRTLINIANASLTCNTSSNGSRGQSIWLTQGCLLTSRYTDVKEVILEMKFIGKTQSTTAVADSRNAKTITNVGCKKDF